MNVILLYFFEVKHCGYILYNEIEEGETPPFGTQYSGGGLGRTQYAKGQYAVRNNSVKSYAALKNSHFLNRFP